MSEDPRARTPEERARQTWLDVAPRFVEFYFGSIWSPSKRALPLAEPRRVSPQLTTLFLGGLALAQVIVWTLGSSALAEDTGNVATLVRRLDPETLPAKALMFVTFAAVPLHAILLRSAASEPEDTVNALLAWAAAAIPTVTLFTVLSAGTWCPELFVYGMVVVGPWALIHFGRCLHAFARPRPAR